MDYCFVGTLRDREVLDLVIGRPVADDETEAVDLPGYRLARVVEEPYPALVEDAGARVPGLLVRGLDAVESARVAWFEGREFAPRAVEVIRLTGGADDPGGKTPIQAVIQAPTEILDVDSGPWDFAAWQCHEKPLLLTLARGHMALFDRVGLDEAIRRWDEAREALKPRKPDL